MIPDRFDYHAAATVDEAIDLLVRHGGDAKVLAGGHSLLPRMKLREARPRVLVDIGRIGELRGVRDESSGAGHVTIGATTTHAEIEHDGVLVDLVPLLPQAASVVSDPLIRNRGTIGGSLAEVDPQGDWPAVALALDATIHCVGPDGGRTLPVAKAFVDAHRSALDPAEVVTGIRVPVTPEATHGVYLKRTHPASGYAMVGVAAVITVEDGVCVHCRIGVTGAGRVPTRALAAEERLVGRPLTAVTIADAAAQASQDLRPYGDALASAEYRSHLLGVQTARALTDLARRAGVGER